MKKRVSVSVCIAPLVCVLTLLTNCSILNGDLPQTVIIPPKTIPSGISVSPVLYVDVTQGTAPLLAAKNYVLDGGALRGMPFFEYVIVGPATIVRTGNGHLELDTSALNTIFDNRNTYIKPLRDTGIKVILGIQGNPNDSFGFGNLTQTEAIAIAEEIDRWVSFYRLNGVDFYDTASPSSSYPPSPEFTAFYQEKIDEWRVTTPAITDAEIEANLWKEGASSFMLLIMAMQSRNAVYSEDTTSDSLNSGRVLFVHNKNFGANLFESVRDAYMPDAYTGHGSGAEDFLTYLLQEYDPSGDYWVYANEDSVNKLTPMQIWQRGEKERANFTAMKSAPLAIDLSAANLNPSSVTAASQTFAFVNPANPGDFSDTAANRRKWNKYSAIYYTNLPSTDVSVVLSATSQVLLASGVSRK